MQPSFFRPTPRKLALLAVPVVGPAILALIGYGMRFRGLGIGESLQFVPIAVAEFSFWMLEVGLGSDLQRSGFLGIPPLWIYGLVLIGWMLVLYVVACGLAVRIRRTRVQFAGAAAMMLLIESFGLLTLQQGWFPGPGSRKASLGKELIRTQSAAVALQGPCEDRYRFEDYPARAHWTSWFTSRAAKLDGPPGVTTSDGVLVRERTGRGPNFAGSYTVLTWRHCDDPSCETPTVSWSASAIVNSRTGKLVRTQPLVSLYGIEYRRDSRLLIVDPPEGIPDPDSPEGQLILQSMSRGSSGPLSRYFVVDEHQYLTRVCSQAQYDEAGS